MNLLAEPNAEIAAYYAQKSKAVLASDGVDGIVLYTVGPGLWQEMVEGGLSMLSDLGLDNAPKGISVWEGKYIWQPGTYECPEDGYTKPVGEFHAPTDEEWDCIKQNKCPWPDIPNSPGDSTEHA